jgi:hypothetical protein
VAERRKREQQKEERVYWQTFEQPRCYPTEENADITQTTAAVTTDFSASNAYDRALAVWQRAAA